MKYLNKHNITSVVILLVLVIIISVIATFVFKKESKIIETSKVETSVTNMLSIKSKYKLFSKEINTELINTDNKEEKKENMLLEKLHLSKIDNIQEQITNVESFLPDYTQYSYYKTSLETFEAMEIQNLIDNYEENQYIIAINTTDQSKIEIIDSTGVVIDDNTYYTLSKLQEVTNQ